MGVAARGRAYIHFGGPTLDGIADLVLTGERAHDEFGSAVAGGCDLDGDGLGDIIVGARKSDGVGRLNSDRGRVYVFLSGPTLDSNPDLVLEGDVDGGHFGHSLARIGDMNGDGIQEIVVGAPETVVAGIPSGRAYVFSLGELSSRAEPTLDIRPNSCPNPLNPSSQGVIPVALLGSESFDVRDVVVAGLLLEGASPTMSRSSARRATS